MRIASKEQLTLHLAVALAIVACRIIASASTIGLVGRRVANDTNLPHGVLKALNEAGATSVTFNPTLLKRRML